MANHDFVRAGNVWASLSDLTSAEMALLDFNAADAMSGTGGTYALEEDMVIGGGVGITWDFELPVNFNDDVDVIAQLYVSGTTTIDAPLDVLDDATFSADAIFDADVYLNGTALLVQSQAVFLDSVTFDDDVTADSNAYLDGFVRIGGATPVGEDFVCNSVAGFYDTVIIDGGMDLRDTLITSGAGRISARRTQRQVAGADANASYAVTAYDHVYVPAGTLTADKNYTIDDTGAVNGDRMEFSTRDTAFAISIRRPGGTQIGSIKFATGLYRSMIAERVAGVWDIVHWHPVDA